MTVTSQELVVEEVEVEEEEESPGELNALPRMAELRQGGTECNPQHHPAKRERPT